MYISKEKNGLYTDDDCFKKALTDAISVAAKAIGIGGKVHFEKDPTKYDQRDTTGNKSKGTEKPKEDPFIEGLKDDERKADIAAVCKEIQAIRVRLRVEEKSFNAAFKEKYGVDYYDADLGVLNKCLADMKSKNGGKK